VPSPLAHYAFAALSLRAVGFQRRELALVPLWAIVPDLDVLTALLWMLAGPNAPIGADALRTGAHLFGHRGFSHTFLAAILAAGIAWGIKHRRAGVGVGVAWAGHVVLDTVTTWPTRPFWPVSNVEWHVPIVTTLDPVLTLASAAVTVTVLGPLVLEKLAWPDPAKRQAWTSRARQLQEPVMASVLGALVLAAATAGTAGLLAGETAFPAHTPRTVTVDPAPSTSPDTYNATTRWVPWAQGTTEPVPRVDDRANRSSQVPVDALECTIDALGPYSTVETPVFRVTQDGQDTVVGAQDLMRNATGTGGPWTWFELDNATIQEAWITGDDGRGSWLAYPIPQRVVEDASCL
jgi:membrane-bound metal-dependent hydrolase YbcI (DUF457 family)